MTMTMKMKKSAKRLNGTQTNQNRQRLFRLSLQVRFFHLYWVFMNPRFIYLKADCILLTLQHA